MFVCVRACMGAPVCVRASVRACKRGFRSLRQQQEHCSHCGTRCASGRGPAACGGGCHTGRGSRHHKTFQAREVECEAWVLPLSLEGGTHTPARTQPQLLLRGYALPDVCVGGAAAIARALGRELAATRPRLPTDGGGSANNNNTPHSPTAAASCTFSSHGVAMAPAMYQLERRAEGDGAAGLVLVLVLLGVVLGLATAWVTAIPRELRWLRRAGRSEAGALNPTLAVLCAAASMLAVPCCLGERTVLQFSQNATSSVGKSCSNSRP